MSSWNTYIAKRNHASFLTEMEESEGAAKAKMDLLKVSYYSFLLSDSVKNYYYRALPPLEVKRNTQLHIFHTKISNKFIMMQQDQQTEAFYSFIADHLFTLPPYTPCHRTHPLFSISSVDFTQCAFCCNKSRSNSACQFTLLAGNLKSLKERTEDWWDALKRKRYWRDGAKGSSARKASKVGRGRELHLSEGFPRWLTHVSAPLSTSAQRWISGQCCASGRKGGAGRTFPGQSQQSAACLSAPRKLQEHLHYSNNTACKNTLRAAPAALRCQDERD